MAKWLLALAGLLLLGIVLLPMRAVVPYVAPDLTATAITGTVWDGRLMGAEFRGVPLGNLDVGLDGAELLRGRLRLDFARDGLRALSGRIGTSGKVHVVEALDGPLSLELPFAFNPVLEAEFRNAAFQIDSAGTCLAASGDVSARLSRIPALGTTPPMKGSFACDQGAFYLPLATRDDRLRIGVHVWADRRYRADLIIAGQSLPVQLALAAAGFVPGPDGSTMRIEGMF
jgi:general secretion pathway protein N